MLVNNTVVCDHFKSIVAGGGQNGKKETTCGRPSGDHQWVSPSCKTLTPPPPPPLPPLLFFSGTAHIPEYNPSISTKHIECSGRKQRL